jgi:hypothetical protein
MGPGSGGAIRPGQHHAQAGDELKTPAGASTSHRTGLTRGGRHGFYLGHKVP